MRRSYLSLRLLGRRSGQILVWNLPTEKLETLATPTTHTNTNIFQRIKDAFETARSIALSILIITGGAAAVVAVGREVFSNDILIDVTEISKQIADSGISAPTLAAELAARVRTIQIEADSERTLPTIELAYILQSENKTKALPTLPSSTQTLLIEHVEPIPELITSAADSRVRTAIDYIRHVFGRQDNRLTVVLTTSEDKKYEARIRLRRKGVDDVATVSTASIDELLIEVPRWLAKELFPEEYLLSQFAMDRRQKDRTFTQTRALIQEFSHRRDAVDNSFLQTMLGDIAFHKKSYEEASAIYRSVLNNNPHFRNLILYRLSQSLVYESKQDEAIALLSKEILSKAVADDLIGYLALVYAQADSRPEVRMFSSRCERLGTCLSLAALAKRLEQSSTTSAASSNALGVLRYQDGATDAAEALFRQANSLDSQYFSALNNLGVILLIKGDKGTALLKFQNAVIAHEDSGVVQLNLGNALEAIGRSEEAAKYFANAARLERENLVCHTCWALSLVNSYQIDEAMSAIKSGLTLDPTNTTLQLVSGLAFAKIGCYRDAAEAYEVALATVDKRVNRAMIYRNYGEVLLILGRRADAISAFRNEWRSMGFRESESDTLGVLTTQFYLGSNKSRAQVVDEFNMEAEQIDTRTPWQRTELSNSYRRMAEALLWAGQYGRALASAKHAVDLDPKDWESHFTLGKVYAAYEKGPLARNEYRLAQFLGGDKDVALLIAWTGSLKKERLFKVEKSVRKEFRIHPLACLPKDF